MKGFDLIALQYGRFPQGNLTRPNSGPNLDDAEKIDVYDQVRLNWDYFVDYVWGHSKFCTDVV